MKSRFVITIVFITLIIGLCTATWAQEEKNDIFIITPSVTFSWYPYVDFKTEASTKTEVDLNNYGLSFIMGLKLFDKVGVYLNLKIDDPTFKKLVDIAGYVTAYHFLLKFDYHSFGGTVTWTGDTPNPIPGEVYNFRNQWTNVSLLFRLDQLTIENDVIRILLAGLYLFGGRNLAAVGIGYAIFDMPLEYQVESNSKLSNPGFGLIKGNLWGFSILWDTQTKSMEYPVYQIDFSYPYALLAYLFANIWIYLDWFHGFPIAVDGNITQHMQYTIVKGIIGLQHIWAIGEKGKIGLAVGVELLEETISAHNNDITIDFWSWHIGPAVRLSARW